MSKQNGEGRYRRELHIQQKVVSIQIYAHVHSVRHHRAGLSMIRQKNTYTSLMLAVTRLSSKLTDPSTMASPVQLTFPPTQSPAETSKINGTNHDNCRFVIAKTVTCAIYKQVRA